MVASSVRLFLCLVSAAAIFYCTIFSGEHNASWCGCSFVPLDSPLPFLCVNAMQDFGVCALSVATVCVCACNFRCISLSPNNHSVCLSRQQSKRASTIGQKTEDIPDENIYF